MFKELKKDSKGFVFRSAAKKVNKSTQYSSFWMNDEREISNPIILNLLNGKKTTQNEYQLFLNLIG